MNQIEYANKFQAEFYGSKQLWIISHIAMVAFIGGSAGSQNLTTLIVLRFLTDTFGGSTIINSGGVLADIFAPTQRALPSPCIASHLSLVPFSVLSSVTSSRSMLDGGGCREFAALRSASSVSLLGVFFSMRHTQSRGCQFGVLGILGIVFISETYGPVIPLNRASLLSKADGQTYISVLEKNQGGKKPSEVFQKALVRPWVLLFMEPIVLVASLYIAVIYASIYMFLPGMSVVFNVERGWNEGIGGLAFLGMAVGIVL